MAASTGVKSRGLWLLLTIIGIAVSVMFVLIPIEQDLKEAGFYIGIALALIGIIKAIVSDDTKGWIITFGIVICFIGFTPVVYQLWKLSMSDYSGDLRDQALTQQMSSTQIPAQRGSIYDRNGNVLAQSATVWNVTVSPKQIADTKTKEGDPTMQQLVATHLSNILEDVSYSDVMEKISDTGKQFAYIQKRVSRPVVEEIMEAEEEYGLNGIYFEEDTRRYYPYGDFASTILGFCNTDGQGAYGIEAYYNKQLAGTPGRVLSAKNAVGNEMDQSYQEQFEPVDGYSLVLTIDEVVQHYLEKAMDTALEAHGVHNRVAGIVMDVNTGEILGMATKGDFDPNDPLTITDKEALSRLAGLTGDAYTQQLQEEQFAQWRNKAISDPYEPGSVFKIITLAAALENGTVDPTNSFDCYGVLQVANRSIHCWKTAGHGHQTLNEILINSCNPGFMTVGAMLGAETFYKYFEAFGLTEPTGIDIPGEATSIYHKLNNIGVVELASSSFGQTFKVTPIQLITAVSAAINGGYLLQPYVVKEIIDAEGNVISSNSRTVRRQVISEETSALVADMAEKVVSEGSGNGAYVAGYRVGGKTGTSQKLDKLDENGEVTDHVLSFYGYAPADDPQVAVLILIDEPELKTAYGSVIAAPVVGAIMSDILPYLDVEPKYTPEELEKREIYVADVVGQKPHEAQAIMANDGLSSKLMGSGVEIIRQVPTPGAPVPKGSTVILYTDDTTEAPTVAVPDILGKSGEETNKIITDNRLNLRIVGADITQGETVAVSQNPAAGEVLEIGSVVTIEFINPEVVEEISDTEAPLVGTE